MHVFINDNSVILVYQASILDIDKGYVVKANGKELLLKNSNSSNKIYIDIPVLFVSNHTEGIIINSQDIQANKDDMKKFYEDLQKFYPEEYPSGFKLQYIEKKNIITDNLNRIVLFNNITPKQDDLRKMYDIYDRYNHYTLFMKITLAIKLSDAKNTFIKKIIYTTKFSRKTIQVKNNYYDIFIFDSDIYGKLAYDTLTGSLYWMKKSDIMVKLLKDTFVNNFSKSYSIENIIAVSLHTEYGAITYE
jgi:hypothetical protein